MAECSINATKNSGEYGIPYLCIHEIDLCTNGVVNIVHNKAKKNKKRSHSQVSSPFTYEDNGSPYSNNDTDIMSHCISFKMPHRSGHSVKRKNKEKNNQKPIEMLPFGKNSCHS